MHVYHHNLLIYFLRFFCCDFCWLIKETYYQIAGIQRVATTFTCLLFSYRWAYFTCSQQQPIRWAKTPSTPLLRHRFPFFGRITETNRAAFEKKNKIQTRGRAKQKSIARLELSGIFAPILGRAPDSCHLIGKRREAERRPSLSLSLPSPSPCLSLSLSHSVSP